MFSSGVYYTGGSVNPARTFGPCVVLGSFHAYHWIYWIGPFLGSLVATGFYLLVKALEYETVNPEQDTDVPINGSRRSTMRSSIDPLRQESVSQGHPETKSTDDCEKSYQASDNLEAGRR